MTEWFIGYNVDQVTIIHYLSRLFSAVSVPKGKDVKLCNSWVLHCSWWTSAKPVWTCEWYMV